MRGVLLVRKDSPIQTLRDLAGKRIAFGGGRNAFFASVVPRALLARAGLSGRYTEVSVAGPVTAVLAQLRDGTIDAAGSGSQILANALVREQLGIEQLRVLAQSEPLPSLAWLAGPNLARDLREEIQGELLQFGAEAPGHAAMRAAGIERLAPADAQTYQVVAPYLAQAHPP
jgi:phosphonate transport system substrate-binding protein